MNIRSKRFRPAVAIGAIAVGATIALTGCSSSDDNNDSPATTGSVAADGSVPAEASEQNESSLTAAQAQETLRAALNPDTAVADVPNYVDLSSSANADGEADFVNATAKVFTAAGYTPDTFTVDSVEAVDDTNATANVTVDGPHASSDAKVTFVKVDDTWKVTSAAFQELASIGQGHGGSGASADETVTEETTEAAS